ncbi:putative ferric reductase transmembrane component [Aspergillus affinis]|uniref:putative ferric reductase transmembrane component n=1 Tax=Aspergillus affinis TaxID=1070780 RepID=UPI0022FE90D5|nr:putative ferric reductase transmembrane component [Aspergillus affinis]KAI9043149.1 putative ferric reductase transmembrane component [Aspergillus affinis]
MFGHIKHIKAKFHRHKGNKEPVAPNDKPVATTGTLNTKDQPQAAAPAKSSPAISSHHVPKKPAEKAPEAEKQPDGSKDLWVEALNSLDKPKQDILKKMGFNTSSVQSGSTKSSIDDLIGVVKTKQEECEKNFWKVKVGNENILLRDYTSSIVDWLGTAGDIAVQFAPPQAAIPWAVIKSAMQIPVIEGEQMAALLTTTEKIVSVISRGQVYENVYLKNQTVADDLSKNLQSALTRIYSTSLDLLADSGGLFSKKTASRTLHAILNPGKASGGISSINSQEDDLMRDVSACEVRRSANADDSMIEMLNALNAPMKQVDEGIQHLLTKMKAKERIQMLEWISAIPFGKNHNNVKGRRTPDTGKWLLEHDDFRNWDQGESSIFWLQGSLGTGKTYLTSTVIDFVHDRLKENPRDEGFAFFYCDKNEPQRSDPLSALQSIVRQLSTTMKNPDAVQHKLEALYIKCREKTTIIIDAMDECDPESRDKLIDALKLFVSNSPTKHIKIFISSRPDPEIQNLLEKTPNVGIDASDNKEDIRKYLSEELEKRARKEPSFGPLKERVIETLLGRCQGMFQWAALQIHQIQRCKSEASVWKRLENLPDGLQKAYDEVWGQIENLEDCDKLIVSRAIMWVMAAKTPLLSGQLLCAVRINVTGDEPALAGEIDEQGLLWLCNNLLTLDSQQKVWRFAHLSVREYLETKMNWHLPQVNLHVASACLSLFINTYDKEEEGIKLMEWEKDPEPTDIYYPMHHLQLYIRHYWAKHVQVACDEEGKLSMLLKRFLGSPEESSKEYQKWVSLIRKDAFDILKITDFSVWEIDADYSYLIASGFTTEKGLDTNDLNQARRPLAPDQWWNHTHWSRVDRAWMEEEYQRAQNPTVNEFDSELLPANSAVFAMCHFSFGTILADWWEKMEFDPFCVNERGHNLLTLAARVGCTEICRALVEKGTDINLQVGSSRWATYGSALIAAAHRGHTDTVRYLVESGADVNMKAQNGEYATALIAALSSQSIDIARYLVQNANADVNISQILPAKESTKWGIGEPIVLLTPVGLSANVNGTDLLKMIVDAGANVNIQAQSGNPLCVALGAGNVEAVKYLIQEAKADVNLPISNASFCTILEQAVSVNRDLDIVKWLVEAGANVNPSEFGTRGPPLFTAAAAESSPQSKPDLLCYLINAGADIERGDGERSPVIFAWDHRKIQAVECLVEAGAKFDAQDALERAVDSDFLAGARYLINETPDRKQLVLNGTGGDLLQVAATRSLSLVELLVKSGANINVDSEVGDYGSPLIAASGPRGDIETVEWLIEAGANVNMLVQHGDYECPLAAVIMGSGRLKVVKALVNAGADVNQSLQRAEYPTLLAAAAGEEQINILRCLLDAGATVDPSLVQGEYREALEAAKELHDSDDGYVDSENDIGFGLFM